MISEAVTVGGPQFPEALEPPLNLKRCAQDASPTRLHMTFQKFALRTNYVLRILRQHFWSFSRTGSDKIIEEVYWLHWTANHAQSCQIQRERIRAYYPQITEHWIRERGLSISHQHSTIFCQGFPRNIEHLRTFAKSASVLCNPLINACEKADFLAKLFAEFSSGP